MIIRFIIFFAIILVVEFYFLQAVKTFVQDFSQGKKHFILWTAYFFAGFSIAIGLMAIVYPPGKWNTFLRFISSAAFIVIVCKLLGCTFLIIDDFIRLIRWIISLFR